MNDLGIGYNEGPVTASDGHNEKLYKTNDSAGSVKSPDGTKWWYKYGKLHRDEGPALISPDGTETWYQNGIFHRDGGPAITERGSAGYSNGAKKWYHYGKLHRTDGPALITSNGTEVWYHYGEIVHKN